MNGRRIRPAQGKLDATLRAMPSKSVTHRALIASALASGTSRLHEPLDADDTRCTRDGLVELGLTIECSPGIWTVCGRGGRVPGRGRLFLRDSGTSMRFLTAVAALGERSSTLDGSSRLRERPVRELASVLTSLSADVRLGESPGGLPLVAGGAPPRGGKARVPAGVSSQFASALLLIAPRLAGGLELELAPPAVSWPYVEVTARVLEAFGVPVERLDALRWRVPSISYGGRDYRVEGDHSSASYFLAAAAVCGGTIRVEQLDSGSAQPDARLGRILQQLGCSVRSDPGGIRVEGEGSLPPFDIEMADCPDLVPTVAVIGMFAGGPCTIRGVAHLRHKESDRLEQLALNLRALGRDATAAEDRLEIGPPRGDLRGATVLTAADHRIAMAFAVAGLRIEGVSIDDPECVGKSNPAFWSQFERLEG